MVKIALWNYYDIAIPQLCMDFLHATKYYKVGEYFQV